ncbi:MAG TPA: hypothetical protein VH165_05060 [Kofleriaceae bacterium]|jgi:hypothetical protein|nr:hypothetical protein [Kofleriaceae bacterium]
MRTSSRTAIVVGAIALTGALTARTARADDPPFAIGSQARWFVLGGVTSGGTVAFDDRGGYVGGELSLARLHDANYFGFYADGYYDFGIGGTYATGGVELGHKFVGIDGGAALRFANGTTDAGVAARLNLTAGVFGIYVRYAYFDAMTDKNVLQVGAMLKFPLASPF